MTTWQANNIAQFRITLPWHDYGFSSGQPRPDGPGVAITHSPRSEDPMDRQLFVELSIAAHGADCAEGGLFRGSDGPIGGWVGAVRAPVTRERDDQGFVVDAVCRRCGWRP